MAAAQSAGYQSCGFVQSNENYLRISTLLNYVEMELYYKILHDPNYGGFSTDPLKLYKQLKKHDIKIQALLNQKLISKEEYQLIFPASQETYSQEFTVNLFFALSKHCVKKFPPVIISGSKRDSTALFLEELDKLQALNKCRTLKDSVNASQEKSDETWDEILEILKKLGYDVGKVINLQCVNLDDSRKFRFALLCSEVNLLISACADLVKTSEVNTLALNKLKINLSDAVSEAAEGDVKQEDNGSVSQDDKDLMEIKEDIDDTASQLSDVMTQLVQLKPQIKFWREKNLEGDVIILDEQLTNLKNRVNEQSCRVGSLFSSVSLDIVKIKERTSFYGDDKFIVVPPNFKRDRSDSRLSHTSHTSHAKVDRSNSTSHVN